VIIPAAINMAKSTGSLIIVKNILEFRIIYKYEQQVINKQKLSQK